MSFHMTWLFEGVIYHFTWLWRSHMSFHMTLKESFIISHDSVISFHMTPSCLSYICISFVGLFCKRDL